MNGLRAMLTRLVATAVLAVVALTALACFDHLLHPNKISLGEAREFNQFPLYWLGESYSGLPLTRIESFGSEPGEFKNIHFDPAVSFSYGKETCSDDSSCWTPIWIHIQPYCLDPPQEVLSWIQHLASTDEYSDNSISEVEVRGVQGYRFGERRIYLWTSSSSIIVDANTRDLNVMQLAAGLIPISEDSGTTPQQLPPPVTTPCPETPGT